MAAEIVQIDPQDLTSQSYESQDVNLIPSFEVATNLTSSSYIEYFVYDLNQNLLSTEYNFVDYKVLNDGQSAGTGVLSQIEIDPEKDLINLGYDQGEYNVYYNFLNKQIGSNLQQLYIVEISSDRTEIRLDSTVLTNEDIVEQTTLFINERENSEYFLDFYLNFGDNILSIANNIALDNEDPNNPTVLIKLYEPLLDGFDVNSTLWVVTSVEEPLAYKVSFTPEPIVFDDTIKIKGPNFNIELKDQVNNSTQELSYTDLITTSLTSSQNQLNSLLEEKEIDINIDWTNFEDFIHFSSAQTRLENFYYKVSLIEQYSSSISLIESNITGSTSASLSVNESKAVLESKINSIITNFDGWDYYLYYSSGSWAWPKLTTEPPYLLASTGSALVLNWYPNIIESSSLYDNNNKDNLLFSIPEYLREDPDNAPYELFIDMVAQHFDNIWIYYKDVTQKFNADNRLESGISKDIVADAIRDFGIKLYQNNFSNQDLYTAFLGLTPEGGLFPFPNITGSLPTPSGFEYVDTLISASNDYIPLDDVNKSLYKRIYHNLPYLLKSKGTIPGLRALITSYGIPDTILRIKEYGGKDKVDSNDWDYWQNEFNYTFSTEGNNFISSSWGLNSDWNSPSGVPSTLAFRFKTNGLPQTNIPYSQSLITLNDPSNEYFTIHLTYTGSGYSSGSYNGSIKDPYYQFATLTFVPEAQANQNLSASVYLPFFDGNWWSVMVTRTGSNFSLYAGNKIYEGGNNGTTIGFFSSSSVTSLDSSWTKTETLFVASSSLFNGNSYTPFSGSLQELRYYTTLISESEFKDYIMNPSSIEGNLTNSGPNELAFRASLGGELYTGSVSIHPKVTGSWIATSSFTSNSNFNFSQTPTFTPNTEYFFYDQPVAGIKNAVSDKIRLENDNLPSGSTLSPIRRLSQTTEASASYTPNINLLEVAFSPQDEINDDINSSIGFFNIGDYIGDPAFRSSRLTSYPDLDQLRNNYFEKYTKNYNLVDFIRLIKFFDNSLFKMIRDFVPARTSLASGIVIKQTLLERNRYPEPQMSWEDLDISGTLKPQWNNYNPGTVENFSGGTAGMFEPFNGVDTSPYGADGNGPDNRFGITQSWNETYLTLSGSVTIVHDSQDEFYNGEFFGSTIIVTTQSLNQSYPSSYTTFEYKPVHYYSSTSNPPFGDGAGAFGNDEWLNYFIDPVTSPSPGEIYFYNFTTITVSPFSISRNTRYIKVAKEDCNGNNNTNTLENVNSIFVYNSIQGNYKEYKVTLFGEGADFILFECLTPYVSFNDTTFPNQKLDYYSSASNPATQSFSGTTIGFNPVDTWGSISGNSLNYFNTSSGNYTLQNTPNTLLYITASLTVSGSVGGGGSDMVLRSINLKTGDITTIATESLAGGSNVTRTITSSYYALEGDRVFVSIRNILGGNFTVKSGSFLVTQSRAVETVSCSPIAFFEPNITEANFYNSDENALINNATENRQSLLYQDVDYSQGALVPVNFETILSGSATRAMVQDSNYTLQRHINPRYDGSRTTSQLLNVWTESDTNTFGKLPTIDSTKIYVAYCDFIGGWPPERMNASAAHILYLIGTDGNVIIPNTSENSLDINKGTFETGERISISSQTNSTTGGTNYRNIIKGGTRIEPILYTQSGSSPNAQWNTTMSFQDIVLTSSGSVGDYTALYNKISTTQPLSWGSPALVIYNNTVSGIPLVGYGYQIPSNAVIEGVNIILTATIRVAASRDAYADNTVNTTLQFSKNGVEYVGSPQTFSKYIASNNPSEPTVFTHSISYTIPNSALVAGDLYQLTILRNNVNISIYNIQGDGTSFQVYQQPIQTSPITSSGYNSIWGYVDTTNYPNVITSSLPTLTSLYGDPNIKMSDITGSGFNPVVLPWSIEYGDEFRFEGREDFVFQVGKVFSPWYSGSGRITETGSIEVHFNQSLPVSASSSVFNLDHFLIRRYVDDASMVLFEGFKPVGSSGPFLIKPEFVSPSLNKSIDQFIVDLTEKGLL